MELGTKGVFTMVLLQFIFLLLFVFFAKYGGQNKTEVYPMFQDIQVMIFIGFGYLMTFLRKYGYSSVGFNFLLSAITIQWATICQGLPTMNSDYKILISISSLVEADIATATVLISMGAVLGKTSYLQLITMAILEIVFFTANSYLGYVFKVADAGGSIFVHLFGAYFGLSVSYMLGRKRQQTKLEDTLEESNYVSDLFAMIGTIFLWVFWPSFNAVGLTGDDQYRAVINTYFSLASCCVTSFAASLLFTPNHKFSMTHIQNATLAGGVAVGASANLMLHPYGALTTGIFAGILSVYGYAVLSPWLRRRFKLHDTCGVHNLHGMPGVFAGVLGALMAAVASEKDYNESLYDIYPARASPKLEYNPEVSFLKAGLGRTALEQAGFQLLAVSVTFLIAVVAGLITGYILLMNFLRDASYDTANHFDDSVYWNLEKGETLEGSKILEELSSVSSI